MTPRDPEDTFTAEQYRAMIAKEMPEKVFQDRYVIPAYERHGFTRLYHTRRSDRSPAGFPDIVTINPERGLLDIVELKSMRGRATSEQEAWLAAFQNVRMVRVHGIWRPDGIDRLDELIEGI